MEKYEELDMQIVCFSESDVIVCSVGNDDVTGEFEIPGNSGGNT